MTVDQAFTCPRCGNVAFELVYRRTPLTAAGIADAPPNFHPLTLAGQSGCLAIRCVDGCAFQADMSEIEAHLSCA